MWEKFKSGEYKYVLDELKQIVALAPADVMTKVIIELNCLTDEEMENACGLVIQSGADFLKTGTRMGARQYKSDKNGPYKRTDCGPDKSKSRRRNSYKNGV